MTWPADPLARRTLADLGDQLRKAVKGGSLSPDDPRLGELDQVAYRLLDLVERLHLAGWRIGLLHPANVLLAEDRGRAEPVLVDLGFWFSPEALGPPQWLTNNPYAALWGDDDPAQRQFAAPRPDALPVSNDVQVLARLMACVLSGCPEREIKPASPAAVWQALAAAAKDKHAMVADLRLALREMPLSVHFQTSARRGTRPNGKPVGRWWPWVAGVGALVVAGALAVPFLVTPPPGPPGDQGSGDIAKAPNAPPLSPELDRLVTQFKAAPPEKQADIVRQIAALPVETDAAKESQRQWLAHVRGQYLDAWIKRYREADPSSIDPDDRFGSAERIQALHEELVGLLAALPPAADSLKEKENQCLEFSDLRVHELRLGR
jgi:hypothetical protein